MAICRYHPGEEALYQCVECGAPICPVCLVMFGRRAYCRSCARKARPGIPKISATDVGIRTRAATPREAFGFAMKFVVPPIALFLLVVGGYAAYRWRSGAFSFGLSGADMAPRVQVWVTKGGQTYGPYSPATIREMREKGEIEDETLVSIDGRPYTPYREVAGEIGG